MAGGEAGKEAVLPLKGFYDQLEHILSSRMNTGKMEQYLAVIANNSSKGIYLEDGTLVGHLLCLLYTSGSTKFEYGVPKAIPGAVSISLDAEGESSPFYADGIVYFRSVTNNGYSGDLEMALIPEWFRTEILQEKLDAKGVLVENSSVAESVKFALLFEFDGDINAIRHVLYNCSASRPSIESETKEDTIEPGTETLSITADPRSDGLVKARTGDTTDETTYKEWYKTVYTPTEEGGAKA